MIELLKMVEALPDQDGKDDILVKLRELIGEPEDPVFSLVLSAVPYMAYEVHRSNHGTWLWRWEEAGDAESDSVGGFTTYRDAVRDIKRDVRDNLECHYDERVRLLNRLDEEIH